MKATDVLFLTGSLQRRAKESPEWASIFLRREVFDLAKLAEAWLDYDRDCRYGLGLVHSFLALRRPYAALATLETTMLTLAAKA